MKLYAVNMVVFLVFAVSALHGQTSTPTNTGPLCKPADIDATFSFADAPAGEQTIVIHLHNVTSQPCRLRGELAPSFAVDGHGATIETCWLCARDGRPDAEAIRRNNDFVIPGDGYTQVAYRWSSVGDKCQKVDWATIGVEWDGRANLLFQNMHWKPHVCSIMQISGYKSDVIAATRPTTSAETTLKVTPPPVPIYADEFIQLNLELRSSQNVVGPTGRCPELYAVYENGSGATRFEAILPDGYGTLVLNATDEPNLFISGYSDELPAQFKGYMRLCETAGKRTTTTVTLPASLEAPIHVVPQANLNSVRHIVWRAENSSTHEPVFVTADVHFDILDPDTLPQNWGPQVEGIGAGLSVDKTTFTLGETIPLHLRWENFSASKKLGVGECGGPQPRVEIQDALHRVLGTLIDYDMGCMGHGWGPFSVELGKQHSNFASLRYSKMGYFISSDAKPITEPGVYYLLAVWSPPTLEERTDQTESQFPGAKYTFGERYATARSLPVRIDILPGKN
ncbi:hypothetical protein RBB77_04180 [Tunturibacter psychrotolerans]|uniref:DUF4232 domain-containing protein n=1 Tax=Tunturiibacter psychrotolerans TaxID=3069686 RepID=A0AAU7ZT36_9BACT